MAGATAARGQAPRSAPRGPAATRHRRAGPGRTDRDGDMKMDVLVKGRASHGGIKKPATSTPRDLASRTSTRAGAKPSSIPVSAARNAIRSHLNGAPPRSRGGLVDLEITGWENSKASSSADGGVSSLIIWLEKKASNRLGSRRPVKVKKSRTEGGTLTISVPAEDVNAIARMDQFGWAGTTLTIKRVGGGGDDAAKKHTEDTRALLRGVLESRYNFETKILDLSALAEDPVLKEKVFSATQEPLKVFPALMVVLEKSFDSKDELDAAITSVSLANNQLKDLSPVSALSMTLKKLHNLDLSNNNFEKLSSLHTWKNRLLQLRHLILSGNPLENNEPSYPQEVIQWYPQLRMLNNVQVRTEEEIASRAKTTNLPFPIRTALFEDEGGIAENFIRTFFNGFDIDRSKLAELYYDEQSDFSFAVNTGAPRDPDSSTSTEKQEWGDYIKNSRNLKKISNLPTRANRKFRGPKAVAEAFATMPKTKHPDLEAEARKWMIEAHIQPSVPDPTGQSARGVDGFMISVHGEFDEVDVATGAGSKKKRSFDRTFIIGPGGPSGVRIVNDMMTVRAYGGTQAFEADNFEGWNGDVSTPQCQQPAAPAEVANTQAPQLPQGLTIEMAEQMVLEMQKQTGMTIAYSKDCLEQVGWDFNRALEAFASVKANLPADAFVQGV